MTDCLQIYLNQRETPKIFIIYYCLVSMSIHKFGASPKARFPDKPTKNSNEITVYLVSFIKTEIIMYNNI